MQPINLKNHSLLSFNMLVGKGVIRTNEGIIGVDEEF